MCVAVQILSNRADTCTFRHTCSVPRVCEAFTEAFHETEVPYGRG